MKFIRIKDALKGFTVFTLNDIQMIDPALHRRRLIEWQEKEYITKLTKGRYIFSDLDIDENRLYEIANRLYSPSYVSLESALSYYHLIPEAVYGTTSVSSRRTYTFSTPIGDFFYHTIHPRFYFGYEMAEFHSKVYRIASPEKAILDYFYLHPHIKSRQDIQSLRIDPLAFRKRCRRKTLEMQLKKFDKAALAQRIDLLLEIIKESSQDA